MERTPQKTPKIGSRAYREPEGLQEQKLTAQKRRRLSYSQQPVTPAKSDAKVHEDDTEGPCVDLYDSADEAIAEIQLQPEMEMQVLKHELQSLTKAHAQLQSQQQKSAAEVISLRVQVQHLHGQGLASCSEQELHDIGKVLSRAQGRVSVEKTRQAGRINRRLSL